MGNSAPQATGTTKALARESTGVFMFHDEHPSPAAPTPGWVAGINPKGTGEALAYLTGLHRLTYPTRQTPFFSHLCAQGVRVGWVATVGVA